MCASVFALMVRKGQGDSGRYAPGSITLMVRKGQGDSGRYDLLFQST